jgi:hypothetical protein
MARQRRGLPSNVVRPFDRVSRKVPRSLLFMEIRRNGVGGSDGEDRAAFRDCHRPKVARRGSPAFGFPVRLHVTLNPVSATVVKVSDDDFVQSCGQNRHWDLVRSSL